MKHWGVRIITTPCVCSRPEPFNSFKCFKLPLCLISSKWIRPPPWTTPNTSAWKGSRARGQSQVGSFLAMIVQERRSHISSKVFYWVSDGIWRPPAELGRDGKGRGVELAGLLKEVVAGAGSQPWSRASSRGWALRSRAQLKT